MPGIGQLKDDHDLWWTPCHEGQEKEYRAMQNLTRKYAGRAQEAIDRGLFPRPQADAVFPKCLWINEGNANSVKCHIIELCGNDPGQKGAEGAIREQLMWGTTKPQPSERRRRIIVVEDMNRRIAELLGVRLEIPPEFFFAHGRPHLQLSVVNHASTPQADRYWRVQMPGKCSLKANSIDPEDFGDAKDFGRWIVEASFYDRGRIALNSSHNSNGGSITIVEVVSYWATEYENDSWTILLLLDPNERKLRSNTNPELTVPTENYICPYHIATEVLPSATEGLMVQAESRPLYESIVKAHTSVTIEHDRSPSSGTAFVRNLIRASWEELVYRIEFDVNQILVEDGFEHRIYTGDDALEQKNAEIDRNTQSYHDLIVQRRGVLDLRKQVENIMDVFSMDVIDQRLTPHLPTRHTCLLEQERRIWARLHRGLIAVEATISDHMEAFSARAALEGSFAASRQAEAAMEQTREANKQTKIANRHARSAGQLTKIATIIVPCTFVASIFSMGGSFAAGERLFYVYWAISVPVTIALLIWVLHADIKKVWHDWRGRRSKEVKGADKVV